MATYNTFKELAQHLGIDPDHPTVADQQLVRDWIQANPEYEAGDVTNAYLNASPKVFSYNQPPQDTVRPDVSKLNVQVPGIDPNSLGAQTEDTSSTEQISQPKNPDFGKFKDTQLFDKAIGAWSPLAPSMIKGGDASGEASGYRAGATIQDKAAADNAKLMQWSKQRATDNTLADKIAASQADSQWKQNANALGAEGGAAVVASQNEAATPDIMTQKNYQSQQMATATQNLAEVNARKVAAQNNRTKANQTDYKTQLEESQNAYKYNLAMGDNKSGKTDKSTTEDNSNAETTEKKPDTKVDETNENTEQTGPAAETNKQSDATKDATQQLSAKQTADKLIEEVNELNGAQVPDMHTGRDGKQMSKAEHYALIEKEYNDLKAQNPDLPALPQLMSPVGTIASAINDNTN